jgi:hypothetical protein
LDGKREKILGGKRGEEREKEKKKGNSGEIGKRRMGKERSF